MENIKNIDFKGLKVTVDYDSNTDEFLVTMNGYNFKTDSWLFMNDLIIHFIDKTLEPEPKEMMEFIVKFNEFNYNDVSDAAKNKIPTVEDRNKPFVNEYVNTFKANENV